MTKIAIVGAGLSGLVAARRLAAHAEVSIFEKSRGVGGRMATRKCERAGIAMQFDHGAQFFTARTPAFQEFLAPLIKRGAIGVWNAKFSELNRSTIQNSWRWDEAKPHYVGIPGMNEVGKALADGLTVNLQTTVSSMAKSGAKWVLGGDTGKQLGEFDWVVLSVPANQARALLPADSKLADSTLVEMQPCYALMLGFAGSMGLPWHAARVLEADISWISVDNSKPGRPDQCCLVAHSTNAWAAANLEVPAAQARAHLLQEVTEVLGIDAAQASHSDLHRWRYANLQRRDGNPPLIDAEQRLAVCGDWLVHGRVEAAFQSAERMLTALLPAL